MSGFELWQSVSRLDREEIRLVGVCVCVCVLKTEVSSRAQCGDDRGDETYSGRRIHDRSREENQQQKTLLSGFKHDIKSHLHLLARLTLPAGPHASS